MYGALAFEMQYYPGGDLSDALQLLRIPDSSLALILRDVLCGVVFTTFVAPEESMTL